MLRSIFFCLVFLFCNFIFSQSTDSRYTKTLNDSVFVVGDIILAPRIEFDFDKASVRPNSKDSVKMIVDFLIRNPFLIVEISTHTDCRGNDNFNQILSLRRTQSVLDLILAVDSDTIFFERIIAIGKGESEPIYSEKFIVESTDDVVLIEQYHQANRRVEIKIIGFINKDFYQNQRAARGVEEVVYVGSNYDNLIFIADKALLDGDHEKAMEFYLRASAVAPVNDNYAIEQYKKLVLLNE